MRRTISLRRLPLVFTVLTALSLGALGGALYISQRNNDRSPATSTRNESATQTQYPLLANRIFAENPNDNILNFAPLRRDLRTYLGGLNLNTSFYLEYLPTGTSIKINQDNPMVGASLLKVPIAMNLFHAVEEKQARLTDTVTIQAGDIDKRSGTLWQKGEGARISLKEAARYAIVDSDNTAVNVLIGAAAGKYDLFEGAIDELDVNLSVENVSQTTLGAQGYSSMLKCLYLACYNSYADSQQILSWMSESTSPPRLRAQLPSNVMVAHKYGTGGGRSESDCGIVYVPKRPYIICVMVDTAPEEANAIISHVSKQVYDYIVHIQ